MEFRITSTSGFKDVIHNLRKYGYEIYDVDDEDCPLVAKIRIGSLEHLMYLHDDLGDELIINNYHGMPSIEVYNDYRE